MIQMIKKRYRNMCLCFPRWYVISLIAAYILPVPVVMIFTAIVLLTSLGFLEMMVAFIGTSVVGFFLFFSYICIYYGVLTFVQAMIDALFFRFDSKMKAIQNVLVSLICFLFLCTGSVLVLLYTYTGHSLWFVFVILMLVGLCAALKFSQVRLRKILHLQDKSK